MHKLKNTHDNYFLMEHPTKKIFPALFVILIITFTVLVILTCLIPGDDNKSQGETRIPGELTQICSEVRAVLDDIDKRAMSAAGEISEDISGENTENILYQTYNSTKWAVSYAMLSADGIIEYAVPEEYESSVGLDIGGFEPAKTIISEKKPLLTDAFTAQEGFTGVEFAQPVMTGRGEYAGSVLAMANPDEFLSEIVTPLEKEKGVSITVMQTDGCILYDSDKNQVGKNLFTDDLFKKYPNLQNMGRKISSQKSGYGTYTFYDSSQAGQTQVKKQAYWDTVSKYGQEWRVIMFRPVVPGV
ncbi:hypothetical protein F1737_00110 [Methanoplanus sp. FWC-SCC4]|uniref:Dret-0059-like sensor domain-containing protein n=1 Tax=Methanochimaera problematica TaxID=2609417 RepID=A0AA97FA48_9EURY|nr:hypothetical protein [Methanoplanus sp. FWC-SCC4]WOF15189.1 hypothetical protein F1737_00110 [Methanoplanus sp. FWC-SCC4]